MPTVRTCTLAAGGAAWASCTWTKSPNQGGVPGQDPNYTDDINLHGAVGFITVGPEYMQSLGGYTTVRNIDVDTTFGSQGSSGFEIVPKSSINEAWLRATGTVTLRGTHAVIYSSSLSGNQNITGNLVVAVTGEDEGASGAYDVYVGGNLTLTSGIAEELNVNGTGTINGGALHSGSFGGVLTLNGGVPGGGVSSSVRIVISQGTTIYCQSNSFADWQTLWLYGTLVWPVRYASAYPKATIVPKSFSAKLVDADTNEEFISFSSWRALAESVQPAAPDVMAGVEFGEPGHTVTGTLVVEGTRLAKVGT